ncbi:Polyketide synthase-nonribosomal peptide synthetase [Colletotrichum tabaci]|uniref:Polyketide synthase-nonribosomal peptide synthetase n=1 Tax=Colletotrichum tabaci TaxID=1209068 RepID=A0AAV9SSL6_9PEZI
MEQQPIFSRWAEIFKVKLADKASVANHIDLVKYYNCAAFDIMGDLTFNEDLNMLAEGECSPWVESIFGSVKAATFLLAFKRYSRVTRLLADTFLKYNPTVQEKQLENWKYCAERVDRRLQRTPKHPDLWSRILEKNEDPESLTMEEQYANAFLFMTAGTETIVSALSATTFYLLRRPLADPLDDHLDRPLRSAAGERSPLPGPVVGHLPGEIAAAYAAGILSRAGGAICIAYYSGLHTMLASGATGNRRGVMLAVGLSWDEANRLCARPEYVGRTSVGAANSPTSVTLSGDADVVDQDVVSQGFPEGAYDVIVAANVLHTTQHLQNTVRQVRRLVKRGGYQVIVETTGDLLSLGFILGVLSGSWLGSHDGDEGRKWAPARHPVRGVGRSTEADRLVVAGLHEERVSAVSLTELGQSLFGRDNFMTATRLQRLQAFLQRARSVQWVTVDCRGPNPQANIEAAVGSDHEVRMVLRDALPGRQSSAAAYPSFSAKLETLLQLDAGSINVHAPLLDLGFDSLLAVETRSWFLKEVSVDVPVLRFLGGETIHEICADAAAQYLSLRSTNGSDTGEGADTNASLTSKTDNSDDPVASSLSSSPSIATPPPTSSSTTSTRASIDLPSAQEDLKPEAPSVKNETEGGHETYSGTNVQTQSRQLPEKRLRNTARVERLSYLQSRLWHLGKALDDSAASNIAVCYTITGPLDVARLREALVNVVAHHPSLRTCFYTDDETGELTQGLLRQPPTSALLLKQVRAVTRADGVIDREFSALKKHEWDLEYGETFGVTLVHVEDEDSYVAIFGYPLIVIDGVSWSIFLRDLGRAYSMQPLSRQAKLCIDAAAEQRRAVESMSGAMQESVSYWERLHTELPQALPFLPLASVTRRRPLRRYEVHKSIRNVDGHLVAKIKDVSRALRATPFHFYLATAQALFAKLLPDLAEICIGVFDANRPEDGSLADVIGYFVNVLPLRFRLDDKRQAPFAEMVRHTSTRELEARRHGHVPFDVILDRLNVPHDDSISPLCQVAFNYRVGAMADVALGDCRLSLDNYSDVQNNRYDLSFGLFESAAGSYSVTVTCKSYLYSRDATEALIGAYVYLLDALASDASRTLSEYTFSGTAIETLGGISLGEEQHKT